MADKDLRWAKTQSQREVDKLGLSDQPAVFDTDWPGGVHIYDLTVLPLRLASWVGVGPGNNESAGKRKTGRIRKGNT